MVASAVTENRGSLIGFELYVLPKPVAVMIEVWDPSLRTPIRGRPDAESEEGCGLGIVDFLAESLGAKGGKVVWARYPYGGVHEY